MKIGDKVVCVDDAIADPRCLQGVKRNAVYVIRDTYRSIFDNGLGLLLIGIRNPHHGISGRELGFFAWRFRLLDELKAENKERNRRATSVPRALPAFTSVSYYPKSLLDLELAVIEGMKEKILG